jgi:hypothetical protein
MKKKKKLKICIRCGKKSCKAPQGKYCIKCGPIVHKENRRKASNKASKIRHDKLRKMCSICGMKKRVPYHTQCEDCIHLCTKCGVNPRKKSKGGYRTWCFKCNKEIKTEYMADPDNRERAKVRDKKYKRSNKEKYAKQARIWRKNNPEKIKIFSCKHRRTEKYKLNRIEYMATYRQSLPYNTIQNKLARNLRGRLGKAIKFGYKSGSAVDDLGCSIEELKLYLEKKLQENMSWDNYGVGVNRWSIDHITPISHFNLTNRKQLLKACNYKNLQPLWNSENSRKCNRA